MFTAIAMIDRLGAAFERVFAGPLQTEVLYDSDGNARVLADRSDIATMLESAFHPIRQAGERHPAILMKLADTLGALAAGARSQLQRMTLVGQLGRVADSLAIQSFSAGDRDEVAARIEAVRLAIAAAEG